MSRSISAQESFERSETPSGLYLQENDITTLFFSSVNAHQSVFGTMIDVYFKAGIHARVVGP
ncbi:hypothetical protein JB92DRAFT_3135725 [Gautieria morchelliformis]|nr:hypothetical protein JB92DRAFT_3137860 [Gautieria morchelliformis]KAF8466830.1 hypothetical protein JB92DRAFT_3135725 [Gautieria morchelliformis]